MKQIDTVKPFERTLKVERAAISEDSRTVELAFASEAPYLRYYGYEILSCDPQSVRLGRLMDGAPLLVNHDTCEQVGVVESVSLDGDRVARAKVRFGRSEDAEEIYQDVLDGIRTKVSVGYMVHKMQFIGNQDGEEVYTVTDWEPFEISIVSVPADNGVGVGRSAEIAEAVAEVKPVQSEGKTMSEANKDVQVIDRAQVERDVRSAELKRIDEIQSIGGQFARSGGTELANEFIRAGKTVDEFRAAMLEKVGKQPVPTAEIGMTEKEARKFSFMRAINALANPGDRRAQEAAAFERESSEAAARAMGKTAQGIMVPADVMRRDLVAGTPTAGGNTVATDLLASSFIELLRNRMALDKLGITVLSGLNGNVAIPRQSGGATAYWVAENSAPTESQQTIDQVTLTPKTVGAFTDISRRLLLQSSIDVEGFVRSDLATILALAIDSAGINGTGASNQPTGVLNTAGIGSVAGGTNGANVTWQNIIDLESAIATANADVGNMAYLTNAKQRGRMKSIQKVATYGDTFIWDNGTAPLNGYGAVISNQVPSNLNKGTSNGVCSAILFGAWNNLVMGLWGGLDLMVDPYTGSTAGTVRVVALQDVDFAVRHAESFAAMKDAL